MTIDHVDWSRYSGKILLFFYIIVFRSMVNKLINCKSSKKKYKIKRKFTFFSKYQIYFISWVENIEIFIRAAHSWKFLCFQHTRWNIFGIHLKKVNILYVYILSVSEKLPVFKFRYFTASWLLLHSCFWLTTDWLGGIKQFHEPWNYDARYAPAFYVRLYIYMYYIYNLIRNYFLIQPSA